jgi:hypothetical protein
MSSNYKYNNIQHNDVKHNIKTNVEHTEQYKQEFDKKYKLCVRVFMKLYDSEHTAYNFLMKNIKKDYNNECIFYHSAGNLQLENKIIKYGDCNDIVDMINYGHLNFTLVSPNKPTEIIFHLSLTFIQQYIHNVEKMEYCTNSYDNDKSYVIMICKGQQSFNDDNQSVIELINYRNIKNLKNRSEEQEIKDGMLCINIESNSYELSLIKSDFDYHEIFSAFLSFLDDKKLTETEKVFKTMILHDKSKIASL